MSITNRWEQQQYLNKGGFSEVYKVKLHGKYYALKKIFPAVLKNPMHRQNIDREIMIMESIDHPKIIKLYQTIRQDDQISLLLEYASGGSLYDKLKNYGKLPEHQVKRYIKDVVEALEYLHNRNYPILHRDIKPQNLLIDSDDNCKIGDFGSANILDGQRLSYVGTLDYMAPQVVECQPHGIPFDVWSLGILIYQLLTGEVPDSEKPYPSFLSRSVEDAIKKLLIKDPAKRMTLAELKEHIWFCEDIYQMKNKKQSKEINKFQQMRKRLKAKVPSLLHKQKSRQSQQIIFKKQKSVLEENEDINRQGDQYILMLKQRQKLKEKIMKNQKLIDKEQSRRRIERPYLLQQIDRIKCAIKQYDNNIGILKARPLKTQAQCRNNIKMLEKRIQQLTEYVKKMPHRVKSDLLRISNFEPTVEVVPVSEYIMKLKTQMLANRRDGLIQLLASIKINQEINGMVQIQNGNRMQTFLQQKPESNQSYFSLNLKKQKQL